jgi:hypothetical protein
VRTIWNTQITLCGQNAEFPYVKAGGTYSDHCGFKGSKLPQQKDQFSIQMREQAFPCSVHIVVQEPFVMHYVSVGLCLPLGAFTFLTVSFMVGVGSQMSKRFSSKKLLSSGI